jgi:hypothetical protein
MHNDNHIKQFSTKKRAEFLDSLIFAGFAGQP